MVQPILTIAIPTHNGGRFLEESIRSAWLETRGISSTEILVLENASTDNTSDILTRLQNEGLNFTWAKNANLLPPGKNYLETIRKASGTYVWFLADDDVFMPGAVKDVLKVLLRDRPTLVVSNFYCVDEDLNKITGHSHNQSIFASGAESLGNLSLQSPLSLKTIGFRQIGLLSANCVKRDVYIEESVEEDIPGDFDFMYVVPAMMLKGTSVFIRKPLVKFRQYKKRWETSDDYSDTLWIDWLITPLLLKKLSRRGYPSAFIAEMTIQRSLSFLWHMSKAKAMGYKITSSFLVEFIKVNKWNTLLIAQLPFALLPPKALHWMSKIYESRLSSTVKRLLGIA